MKSYSTRKGPIRFIEKIRSGKKEPMLLALRIMLGLEISQHHQKSFRKNELVVLRDPKFVNAVAVARQELDITNTDKIPESRKVRWLKEHLEVNKKQRIYDNVIGQLLKEAELSNDAWDAYVRSYIIDLRPPRSKIVYFPKAPMRVEDINEEGEVVIRLRPGLRYEDYLAAWNLFSRLLGRGTRLNKSYTNQERDLNMLKDKSNGLSYREIAIKYFPNGDPALHTDTVKKAIKRQIKLLAGDK